LLPGEVTEEKDDEVVVGSNKAAEEGDELIIKTITIIARLVISIL
jgi:hypothetical protein